MCGHLGKTELSGQIQSLPVQMRDLFRPQRDGQTPSESNTAGAHQPPTCPLALQRFTSPSTNSSRTGPACEIPRPDRPRNAKCDCRRGSCFAEQAGEGRREDLMISSRWFRTKSLAREWSYLSRQPRSASAHAAPRRTVTGCRHAGVCTASAASWASGARPASVARHAGEHPHPGQSVDGAALNALSAPSTLGPEPHTLNT